MAMERWRKEYQNKALVAGYDEKRFHSLQGRIKDRRDWRALSKALRVVPKGTQILNIPCGSGRFFPRLAETDYTMAAVDISQEMIDLAREMYGDYDGKFIFGRFDVEHLPYADNGVDCSLVFRLMHLINDEEASVRILKELKRVTKDWLIVSFHLKYTLKYFSKRLTGRNPAGKMSYGEMMNLIHRADLDLVKIFPTAPLLSQNWVVLLKP